MAMGLRADLERKHSDENQPLSVSNDERGKAESPESGF